MRATPAEAEIAVPPWPLRLARHSKATTVGAAFLTYLAFFHAVYPSVGPATGAFYFCVVSLTGWLFGVRGGVVGAFLSVPTSLATYGVVDPGGLTFAGNVGAVAANLIIGFAAGRWSDQSVQQYQQRLQLQRAERRYRMAVSATRDVIWEYDYQSGRPWYSKEFQEMTKYTKAEGPGSIKDWLEIVHPEDRKAFSEDWTQLAAGLPKASTGFRLICADGNVLHVMTRLSVERDPTGKPLFAVGAMTDVTEQRRSLEQAESLRDASARERQLRMMNEFKSQLLNMASHELNTPISAIRIQLYLLKQQLGETPTAEVARCFGILDRNTARLARLVADTLDVARIQNSRLNLRLEPCRLSSVVEDAIATYQPMAEDRNLQLSAVIRSDPMLQVDAGRLTQVMFNLISNAIKFASSRIDVTLDSDDSGIRVSVRDDGLGIPEHLMGHLFMPFTQLHESSTAGNQGNGLGLYISRNIMELHGGQLSCNSAGEGQGCEFVLRLPAVVAPRGTAAPDVALLPQPSPRPRYQCSKPRPHEAKARQAPERPPRPMGHTCLGRTVAG